jgi:hypothetical protein
MSGADRIISWSTALAVLGVAAVAAVASYEHAYDLVRAHGETVNRSFNPLRGLGDAYSPVVMYQDHAAVVSLAWPMTRSTVRTAR